VKNIQKLTRLLMIAAIAILCLPLYDMVYLYPSTTNVLTDTFRRDSERLAHYLVSEFEITGRQQLSLEQQLRIKESFHLFELTIRTSRGNLLFSTSEHADKVMNFPALSLLEKGKIFSRNLTVPLEGRDKPVSLVEVHIPVLSQGQLEKVFILTRDVSHTRASLEQLISRSSIFLLMVAAIFLTVVFIVTHTIRKAVQKQNESEAYLSASQAQLENKHQELEQLFDQVEQAKYEWQCALDCIDDMILLIDETGLIRRCNEAFVRFLGYSYIKVLGKNWKQLLLPGDQGMISLNHQNGQVYHHQNAVWLQVEFFPYDDGRKEKLTVVRIQKQE